MSHENQASKQESKERNENAFHSIPLDQIHPFLVDRRRMLLYWSNPVSQVLRAMAFKRTTRGRSNFGELMTAKIS
jgi:hypothetical protein